MAAATYYAQVQQLYIAYFGRPADTTGLELWASVIDRANGNIAAVQAGFSASAESQALYGNVSTVDKVIAIYQNVFGRAPEAGGLTFWVNEIESGRLTQAQAAWTIQQSAGPADALVVQNKLVAAQAFTAQIDTTAEIAGYQGAAAAASARAFLANVTTTASAQTAVAGAASALAAAVAVGGTAGTTFNLTTGIDTLTGTANNDVFNAVVDGNTAANTTLGATDTITGGNGTDTLNITTVGASGVNVTQGATISGVETLNIRATTNASTLTDAAGFTAVNSVRSAQDLTISGGLAQGASVGVTSTTGGSIAATYANAATAAVFNANASTTTSVALSGAGLTSATINAFGGANTLGSVALANTVNSVTINAASNVSTGNITGVAANTAVTVTGAGVANLAALAANVTSVNASANTGGVAFTLNAAKNVQFTGSSGNDVVTTNGAYVAADTAVINAGAGTADRLIVANAADVATAASVAKFQGFEVVQTTGATLDLALLNAAGITSVVSSGTTTLNNVTTQAITLGAGTPTINVTGATTVGQIDTLRLTISDEQAAVNTLTVGNVVAAGVENVAFTLTDNLTLSSVAGLNSASNLTFTGAGNLNLTFDAATLANTRIDASALTGTGTVVINASSATGSNGVQINGSATKANNLTGTANADILVGGAGNDTLVGGGGADVLTGGAGTNTFTFAAANYAAASAAALITARDTITDWAAGTNNVIDFDSTLSATAHTTAAVGGTASVSATGLATFAAADNTLALKLAAVVSAVGTDAAGTSVVFNDGGNAYLFVVGDATAGVQATDGLIQLTGVTAATGLTFTGGNITAIA